MKTSEVNSNPTQDTSPMSGYEFEQADTLSRDKTRRYQKKPQRNKSQNNRKYSPAPVALVGLVDTEPRLIHTGLYTALGLILLILAFLQPACYLLVLLVVTLKDHCVYVGVFMGVTCFICALTATFYCLLAVSKRSRRCTLVKLAFLGAIVSALACLIASVFCGILLNELLFLEGFKHDTAIRRDSEGDIIEDKQQPETFWLPLPWPRASVHQILIMVMLTLFGVTFCWTIGMAVALGCELYSCCSSRQDNHYSVNSGPPVMRRKQPGTVKEHPSDLVPEHLSLQHSNGAPVSHTGTLARGPAPVAHPSFFYEGESLPLEQMSD